MNTKNHNQNQQVYVVIYTTCIGGETSVSANVCGTLEKATEEADSFLDEFVSAYSPENYQNHESPIETVFSEITNETHHKYASTYYGDYAYIDIQQQKIL